jgi:hypothetical protein
LQRLAVVWVNHNIGPFCQIYIVTIPLRERSPSLFTWLHFSL